MEAYPVDGHQGYCIFQGKETSQVDAHTGAPAVADAWYWEPCDYEGDVLYSAPYASGADAMFAAQEAYAQGTLTRDGVDTRDCTQQATHLQAAPILTMEERLARAEALLDDLQRMAQEFAATVATLVALYHEPGAN